MPNVCEAISDIGSYSEKQTITIDANNQYLFTKTNLVATQVDVVILSIMGNVGVEDVVLSSRDYSDGTENQYCITKWSKGLFTISCASQNGYFQTADMHFMSPPSGSLGTCTIEFVIKALSPSSVLEKRLI